MKIAIIGGGASGIIAAITAKRLNRDLQVDIFDANKNIGKNTGREAFDVKKFFCYSELNYGKQEYKSIWILKWEKLSK